MAWTYFATTSRSAFPVVLYHWNLHCVKSVQIQCFLCSVFFRIWTEYGDLFRKSPYSVRIQESTDQQKLCIWTLFSQCWVPHGSIEFLLSHMSWFKSVIDFRLIPKTWLSETFFNKKVSCKKVVLKNVAKFTRKQLFQSLWYVGWV